MADLTHAEISKLLKYEPETGKLFWLPRTPGMFTVGKCPAEQACNVWNSRYANTEAFTANAHGYRIGKIYDRTHRAHRVIWLLSHKEWPDGQIDHINGVRSDNRIENLRSVTQAENGKNQRKRRNNTSGVFGVAWDKHNRKWRAVIHNDGKSMFLGQFDDISDAAEARKSAERKLGYHENHGRNP